MSNYNRLRDLFHGLARSASYKQYTSEKDLEIFDRRSANEGAEFFARGFTALRSDLLNGIETGQFTLTSRFGLRTGTCLPRFLYGAWSRVFTDEGQLITGRDEKRAFLAEAAPHVAVDDYGRLTGEIPAEIRGAYASMSFPVYDVSAVSCLSQLLAIFGKIEGGHTSQSEKDVIERFVQTERFLHSFKIDENLQLPHETRPEMGKVKLGSVLERARDLVCRVVAGVNPLDITPAHGSGVSACGTIVHRRYHAPRFVESIHKVWDYSEYYYLGPQHLADEAPVLMKQIPGTLKFKASRYLDNLESFEPVAKVLLVPKDARGPRLISCEPRETMWIQQGLMRLLQGRMERHPLTRGQINYTDQTHNQIAARVGSINPDLATLDLKDASDRITMDLIRRIMPLNWRNALEACRSSKTRLPDGRLVSLCKHAPMGSAVCFPVMALCIWALITAATPSQHRVRGRDRSRTPNVLVYGDDIVVPSVFVPRVIAVLEAVGLAVNRNKSFVKGPFRESCGKEYINGVDITPVRLRTNPDNTAPARMKLIAFHNNVYKRFGQQPDWLTALVHKWHPGVPERSARVHEPKPFFGTDTTWTTFDSLASVLDVYRADNQGLRWKLDIKFDKDGREISNLNRRLYRYLSVEPAGVSYPTDCWSQAFRAVVNPRAECEFGWDALAKRVEFKYRWMPLH